MSFVELVTQALGGGVLGAIGGVAEKVIMQRMANQQQQAEWEHIKDMHKLQAQLDQQKADQGLAITETEGEYAGLAESIKHDASLQADSHIKFDYAQDLIKQHPKLGAFIYIVQTVVIVAQSAVNTIRTLFRPFLTVYLIDLSVSTPAFVPLASAAVFWWIGSRGNASGPRKV